MATPADRVKAGNYVFPEEADPNEDLLYSYEIGSNEVHDLGWEGYVDVAHQLGVESIRTEEVASGVHDGLLYAVMKATVVKGGGNVFESVQAADAATNQVKEPTFVWAVAESRALKRAVKKAYNIYPDDSDSSDIPAPDDAGGAEKPKGVDFDDGHAMSDDYDDNSSPVDAVDEGDDW